MDVNDAYRILGLTAGATEDQVKAAYKTLAQKYDASRYEAGPLHDDAARRMDEVNQAFDAVMSALRTAPQRASAGAQQSAQGPAYAEPRSRYPDIRTLINNGQADEALRQLNGMAGGSGDAEWNFLVGSAYYYKGWVNDALRYFQTAYRLEPSNREYAAALQNLQGSQNGNMNGSPYAGNYAATGMGCSCCDMCTAMMCMDMCCGGFGGRGC